MSTELKTGESVTLSSLDKVIKQLDVTAEWHLLPDLKNPPEGDIFAFLLDKNNVAPTNEDFIFFNQADGPDGNVQLNSSDSVAAQDGGRQSITFALDSIRYEIMSILIGVNLYRAGERDQSWRFIESTSVSLAHKNGATLAMHKIDPKAHRDAICMSLLKLERDGSSWSVTALENEHPSFDHIARQHGIVVAGG